MKRYAANRLEADLLTDIPDHRTDRIIASGQTTDTIGSPDPLCMHMSFAAPDSSTLIPVRPREPMQNDAKDDTAAKCQWT